MNDLPPHTYFVAVFLVGWVVFGVRALRSNDPQLPHYIRPLLLIPVVLMFALLCADLSIELRKANQRSEVRDVIRSVTSDDYTATVNGSLVANPSPIVRALLGMGAVDANHSGPRRERKIDFVLISKNRQVSLSLFQDGSTDNEYWVFSRHSVSYAISRVKIDDLSSLAINGPAPSVKPPSEVVRPD